MTPPTASAFARQRIIIADEPQLAAHVAILRQPFTAEELRAAVRPLLPELRRGSILGYSLEALH